MSENIPKSWQNYGKKIEGGTLVYSYVALIALLATALKENVKCVEICASIGIT